MRVGKKEIKYRMLRIVESSASLQQVTDSELAVYDQAGDPE